MESDSIYIDEDVLAAIQSGNYNSYYGTVSSGNTREALIMEAEDGSRMGSAGGTETQTAGAMLTDAYTPDGYYVNADGIWVS